LRRGQIQGQDVRGNAIVVSAMVPLMNMWGYANDLYSMSRGRASFVMRFDHYAPHLRRQMMIHHFGRQSGCVVERGGFHPKCELFPESREDACADRQTRLRGPRRPN
jgi:hypothetical protein